MIVKLSLLIILTSCNGQNTPQNATSTLNDQHSTIAKGDTVSELSKSIWMIFQDKNNNYWFGSDGQGVHRYDGKTIIHFTTKDGLCNNQIRGIQEDKSGNIYFNTVEGVSKFDGQAFTTLRASAGTSPITEWKIQPDDLWFQGAQDSGAVYRYDGKSLHRLEFPKTKHGDEELLRFPRSQFPNAIYSPYDVYNIYRDSKGNLWFGTATLGACRYDGKSFDWLYEDHLTNPPGGGSFGIRSIIEDKEGKFWFCNTKYRYNIDPNDPAAKGNGLIKYKKEKGIDHVNIKTQYGEDVFYFMSIVEDNKRDLWMATYGGGVWRYDGKSMTHYPVKDGSKDITLFSIYKDNRGDLWLGTHEAGAYKFNGKTFERFRP